MSRLRFGLFVAPIHNIGQSPNYALHKDIELTQLAEQLGYDEVWFGEHHSAGTEYITSPEVMIAYAAAKTSRIKLGTGAVSLPYHNPLWVADRLLLLDHLTRGRMMCALGPGSLASDAKMIGLNMGDLRDAFEEDFDVLMHLLMNDEPISVETARYKLVNATSMLKPYSDPCFEIAVPGVASQVAPRLAGKVGGGLLSLGSTSPEGMQVLRDHWSLLEARAAEFGHTADRSKWRLTSHVHLAETREQAYEEIQHGFMRWFDYYADNTSHPAFTLEGKTFEERLEFLQNARAVIIGTPDDAIREIQGFVDGTGGFGAFLEFHHEWTTWDAKKRHHELMAKFVMPHFQDQLTRAANSYQVAKAGKQAYLAEMTTAMSDYMAKHSK